MPTATSLRCTAVLLALLAAAPALADDPPPIEQGALVRGFALPALGRPEVLAPSAQRQRVDLFDVNEFAIKSSPQESIVVDGEAAQLSYDYRRGLGDGWEAGVFVPLLAQGGGFLDNIIQGWHDTWGLPNGGRDTVPKNRYLYQYTRGKQVLLNVDQGSVGFGDIRLYGGRRLAEHLALRAMVQLPSGDSSHLAGNGAAGGALWLDGGLPVSLLKGLTLYASAGYSYTGSGDVLPQLQKHSMPIGAAGFGYQFTPKWYAGLQVYFHPSPYRNSELAPLSRIAAPLTATLAYRIAPSTTVHLGFQEKASIYASPDFGVFMGVALN